MRALQPLVEGVHVFRDTCNVYVLVRDGTAVLVDFGSGDVLDHLAGIGVESVAAVLLTHHHRDQAHGLPRAVAAGIPIWVPPTERDLFDRVDEHWQQRELYNYYDLRQDRFSLLEPVPVAGTAPEYRTREFGGILVTTVPTPGHTLGSVSYLVEAGGQRLAFTGDLIHSAGKVWSLAATQWTYTLVEGTQATVLSLYELAERAPDLVLPSHGDPIDDPLAAFGLLEERLLAYTNSRRDTPLDLRAWRDEPFEVVTQHLLRNRTSFGTTYVLLSDTGGALFLDFGYDSIVAFPVGDDRSSRRPLLTSLAALRRGFGVRRVEVAIPTHYHDDHVAGMNLLRDVEGTRVWAAAEVAEVLADPARFDLPCLWYDPIPTDRVLPVGEPVRWHEYELVLHPLPGHTRYAVAIEFEVDGQRVLATGDQQTTEWEPGRRAEVLNLQYKNRFRIDDFVASAALYRKVRPDLIVSGHWTPRRVDDAYLDHLAEKADELARLHRELLPLDEVDLEAEGVGAWIRPYQARTAPGVPLEVEVEVRNPLHHTEEVVVRMVVPAGWTCEPPVQQASVAATAHTTFRFTVTPPPAGTVRRARIAADLTVGEHRFGPHAEALVDVR